jgi:murein DD-endopeptidase MepM/ murein hydrolase activator NlpD
MATGAGLKIACLTLLLLSGCIPRGGGDYPIRGSADAETSTGPTAIPRGPVILVPENVIVETTPSWNPATVMRNAQLAGGTAYVVRSGDTLYRIGNETGAGLDAIARANELTAPYTLKVGQRLTIPAGLYHRVSAGETGIAIARAYGVTWSDVVALNGLTEPYILRAGQFLRLPDSASAVPVDDRAQSAQQMADDFTLDIDAIVTGSQPARPGPGQTSPAFATPVTAPASFAAAFGWPLAGNIVARFGSLGGGRVNDGIDIAAALGSPVTSAGDGVVVYSGNEISVFGGLVMVDHGGGWITAYGHLGALNVARGDRVRRGQQLGSVGDTGYVSTPQLHFEIRKDRKPVDPLTKLPVR